MKSPSVQAAEIERRAGLPAGAGDRFTGYGVMGLPFTSGHVLAMRRFPASSIGPGYTSVWHRDPAGRWEFWQDQPDEQACSRYFGSALAGTRRAHIELDWPGESTLQIAIAEAGFAWTVTLGTSAATRAGSILSSQHSGHSRCGRPCRPCPCSHTKYAAPVTSAKLSPPPKGRPGALGMRGGIAVHHPSIRRRDRGDRREPSPSVWHHQAGLTAGWRRARRCGRQPHRARTRRSRTRAEVGISHAMLSALITHRARDPPFGAVSAGCAVAAERARNGLFCVAGTLALAAAGRRRGAWPGPSRPASARLWSSPAVHGRLPV